MLPTDHIYMISNKDVHGVHQQIDIRAPGNIFINSIIRAIYADGATDYTVEFALCDEVRGAIGHIDVLDGSLLSQAPFTEDNCSEWDTGDGKDEYCASYVNIELSGGDPIGTGDGWDFFLYDSRSTNNIINQAYAAVDSPNGKDHAVCPIDYFVEDLKVQMEPKFGVDHHDVFLPRTHLPVCGTLDQD